MTACSVPERTPESSPRPWGLGWRASRRVGAVPGSRGTAPGAVDEGSPWGVSAGRDSSGISPCAHPFAPRGRPPDGGFARRGRGHRRVGVGRVPHGQQAVTNPADPPPARSWRPSRGSRWGGNDAWGGGSWMALSKDGPRPGPWIGRDETDRGVTLWSLGHGRDPARSRGRPSRTRTSPPSKPMEHASRPSRPSQPGGTDAGRKGTHLHLPRISRRLENVRIEKWKKKKAKAGDPNDHKNSRMNVTLAGTSCMTKIKKCVFA